MVGTRRVVEDRKEHTSTMDVDLVIKILSRKRTTVTCGCVKSPENSS